jgi:hypothetical protein
MYELSNVPTRGFPTMLLPIADVAARYSVCTRTIEKWSATPQLEFPPIVRINTRRYLDSDQLAAWDRRNARAATEYQVKRIEQTLAVA